MQPQGFRGVAHLRSDEPHSQQKTRSIILRGRSEDTRATRQVTMSPPFSQPPWELIPAVTPQIGKKGPLVFAKTVSRALKLHNFDQPHHQSESNGKSK